MHDHRGEGVRLLVDPLRCTGIGICAHAGGRVVDLDSWGYPLVPAEGLGGPDARAARAAVRACPRRALAVVSADLRPAASRRSRPAPET